ncbi:acyltransferase domain-containing protein [Streptomyces sp. NBRC 110611]|uniref:acyltransferase domain-containing protein n=1 Tax=Streptomyces sp. NBRC 110611 TaxID=1621259 RepID=UPI000834202A|nr:acyltransferase domain-containing protein [Streptomyces sp. NBRC 110611]
MASAPGGPAAHDACLLPLSAPSAGGLAALLGSYRELARAAADGRGGPEPAALCRAAMDAPHHEHRAFAVAHSYAGLVEALDMAAEPGGVTDGAPPRSERGLVFVFAGQGHQWFGMGRELLRTEPAFRAAVARCEAAVRRHVDFSVREQLALDEDESRIGEIDVLQPVLFTVQVALAELWRSWGIEPDAVVGHSMGEIAAAHIAGALSLEDAAMIACRRSALLRRISGKGALAVAELSPEEAAGLAAGTGGRVSVAGFNSPVLSVLAGDADSLEEITGRLDAQDVYCKLIKGTVASHSHYVEELRDDLAVALKDLRPGRARVPMYSTVTRERLTGTELTAPYWMRNLREPVRFAETVTALRARGFGVFLEISAHPVLTGSVQQCLEHGGLTGRALPSGRRRAERSSVLTSLGSLYALGRDPRWAAVGRAGSPARPALTPYQAALASAVLGPGPAAPAGRGAADRA